MTTTSDEKAAKEAAKARSADMAKREKELNSARTGKGTRIFLGMTRGRNPVEIQYENWDDSVPDSLPLSTQEFLEIRKLDEKEILARLLLGDNEVFYNEASDPLKEFVDPTWSEDAQKAFRLVVRNYSTNANVSIDDAVELIKPGFAAAQEKLKVKESVSA